MDGNGRWAKARGLPRTAGHEAGEKALFDVVQGAIQIGVKELSAYAFSTENWRRSAEEVRFLMGFNRDVLRRRRDEMNDLGVKIQWVGRPQKLWASVINELQEAQELTKKNKVLTLNMCVNYGGRAEIDSFDLPVSSAPQTFYHGNRSMPRWYLWMFCGQMLIATPYGKQLKSMRCVIADLVKPKNFYQRYQFKGLKPQSTLLQPRQVLPAWCI